MKTSIHEDPRIVAAAERQMKAWARTQEAEFQRSSTPQRQTAGAVAYLAISREAGAEGTTIGRLLGERLGWEVYDKNLLDQVAQRFDEPRPMLDIVDETPTNWVYDVLGTWMDHNIITHEKYVAHVGRTIQSLARRASAVFVGRGAMFLLPRDRTLSVRLVASERHRVKWLMQLRHLDAATARRFMVEADRGRREFIERFFHQDIADPHLYHMVLNVERLGTAGAVEQILLAVQRSWRLK
jgi:cytidylate kinase